MELSWGRLVPLNEVSCSLSGPTGLSDFAWKFEPKSQVWVLPPTCPCLSPPVLSLDGFGIILLVSCLEFELSGHHGALG